MHPDITIFHNPSCGTSRNVLVLIREAGFEPRVVNYLTTPYTREQLAGLLNAMALRPRDVLRTKGDLYTELDLARADWTDEQLLDFMVNHPVLVERPIVVTPLGARLCRPKERVWEVLPTVRPA
ncbi:arsenate reductase (glutaredoxin) [Hydrogenophaga sp. A37]|nr:arsenate reductase (glutaredoxin) [Hydrogenophaga sp. A37]